MAWILSFLFCTLYVFLNHKKIWNFAKHHLNNTNQQSQRVWPSGCEKVTSVSPWDHMFYFHGGQTIQTLEPLGVPLWLWNQVEVYASWLGHAIIKKKKHKSTSLTPRGWPRGIRQGLKSLLNSKVSCSILLISNYWGHLTQGISVLNNCRRILLRGHLDDSGSSIYATQWKDI